MALTNLLYPVKDTVFAMYQSSRWRAAEDPVLPADRMMWRLLAESGEYVGAVWLPEGFTYLGNGVGSIWGKVLDERGIPIIQELELVGPLGSQH